MVKSFFFVLILILLSVTCTFSQAPILSYPSSVVLNTGQPISSILPLNQGGSIPATAYSATHTIAGTGTTGSFDGIGISASFSKPNDLTVDHNGNIFIADLDNNKIRKVTPGGVVTTFAGSGTAASVDGKGLSASFFSPAGIVCDKQGNLYVTELTGRRIRKVTTDGTVTTLAGSGNAGSADGMGTAASFYQLNGITIDKSGNLFVVDYEGHKVRKITPAGMVSTFAGSGVSGTVNATGTAARLSYPRGITIDASDNLYVTESFPRLIRKITPDAIVTTFVNIFPILYFYTPQGITADNLGNLYVADNGDNLIKKITPAGVVTTLAGSLATEKNDGVGVNASFNNPVGITYNDAGMLYVTENGGNYLRSISLTGYSIEPMLPPGLNFNNQTGEITGTPLTVTAATDYTVTGYNLSGNSTVKISIATVVPKLAPVISSASSLSAAAGGVITLTGTNFLELTAITVGGAPVVAFAVESPYTIKFKVPAGATSGNIIVSNTYGNSTLPGFVFLNGPKIAYTSPQTFKVGTAITALKPTNGGSIIPEVSYGEVSTFAGNGAQGAANGTAKLASFYNPSGVTVDATGNFYISDQQNNLIRKITPDGMVSTLAGGGFSSNGPGNTVSFSIPCNAVTDLTGNIYVADQWHNVIQKITPAGMVTTLAGTWQQGFADGKGSAARFSYPYGITIDGVGNLYVTELNGCRVRKITPDGVVTTIAGSGKPSSLDGIGTAASFNGPTGITIDAAGYLYIAENRSNRIRKITPTGVVSTFAGNGTPGSTNGVGTAAEFYLPTGIAFDNAGNLYVGDQGNNAIRLITPEGSVSTIVSGSSPILNGPTGLAIDVSNNLYVADYYNNQIKTVNLTGYTITPRLPEGLSMDSKTGVITGTPKNVLPATSYTIIGGNAYGSSRTEITLTIAEPDAAPLITNLFPKVIKAGNLVRITGENFFNITTVSIGGVPVKAFKVASPQLITAIIANEATSGDVKITNAHGTFTLAGAVRPALPNISYSTPQLITVNKLLYGIVPSNSGSEIPNEPTLMTTTLAYGVKTLSGITADASGAVYITDENVIRKITPDGKSTVFAGNGKYGLIDGTASSASFNNLSGITIDLSGNLFVTDTHLIRKITPDGMVTTIAGNNKYGYVNGVGATATFYSPYGIVADGAGNLYVSEDNRIRKITPDGVVTTFAGNNLTGSANGVGINASFNSPKGLAVDVYDNIYVADAGNSLIRKITPDGVVSTVAGSGVAGYANGVGSAARFYNPCGIAVTSNGTIYISDKDNYLIRMITPDGVVSAIVGKGNSFIETVNGIGREAIFQSPTGLTLDGQGNLLFVSDRDKTIQRIALTGYSVSPALPEGIIIDSNSGIISGTLKSKIPATDYVVTGINAAGSNSTTIRLTTDPPPLAPTLTGILPTATIPGKAIKITGDYFFDITGVSIGGVPAKSFSIVSQNLITAVVPQGASAGEVIVTNAYGSAKVTGFNLLPLPNISYNAPAFLTLGVPVTGITPGNKGGAVPNTQPMQQSVLLKGSSLGNAYQAMRDVTVDATGNVYVIDDRYIRKVSPAGTVTNFSTTFDSPSGITVDAADNIYITTIGTKIIYKITPDGKWMKFAGNGLLKSVDGTGSAASFYDPRSIAADAAGNLYVSDSYLHVIRKITPAGVVSTIAGNSEIQGSANGIGANASFYVPMGVITDATGNIYVADTYNNLIRKITPEGLVSTFAGNGQPKTVNGTGTAASFNSPTNMTIDDAGNIYVSENSFVRKITPEGVVTSLSGVGSSIMSIYGITYKAGNLYYVDQGNYILYKVPFTGYTISPELPSGLIFDGTTGTITGTPTKAASATNYTVTATNAYGSHTTNINFAVGAAINDATLKSLTVSDAVLSPVFKSGTTVYTDMIANTISSIVITPVANNAGASININGKTLPTGTSSETLTLNVGSNIITVAVTAQDGITRQTYSLNITRGKKEQVINIATTVLKNYGDDDFNAGATSNNPAAVINYTSSNTAVATIVGSNIHVVGAGTTIITALNAEDDQYLAAAEKKQTLTILPKALLVSADNHMRAQGKANPTFTITYQGLANGDNADKLLVKPVAISTANIASAVGTYPITVSGAQSPNYTFTYNNGTLTITPVANNFSIATNSISCKGANNGTITVNAKQVANYTAALTGNGNTKTYTFSAQTIINNLSAGTYNLCITDAAIAGFQQCYDVVITEPKDLTIYATPNATANNVTLEMNGGNNYKVTLNNDVYQTSSGLLTLPLKIGSNKLLVVTDKPCQGVFEKIINISGNTTPYPNPFFGELFINLGNEIVPNAEVKIYSITDGMLKLKQHFTNQSGVIRLNTVAVSSGIYSLHLSLNGQTIIYKIIKP